MRPRVILTGLAFILLLSGCAGPALRGRLVTFAAEDAQSAALVARASKDLLPKGDQWGACFEAIGTGIGKIQAGPGLKTPVNGILTEAMRLHVLRSLSQTIPPEISAACGQVFLEIMLDAGQRMPGL